MKAAFAWLVLAALAAAQIASRSDVYVHVTDENGAPVTNAEVRASEFGAGDARYRGYTDGKGGVTFRLSGAYYFTAVKDGVSSPTERVDIKANTYERVSLVLPAKKNPAATLPAGIVSAEDTLVPEKARRLYEEGVEKLRDDPRGSEKSLRKAIESHPGYGRAYAMLGMAQLRHNKQPEAEESLAKAIELQNDLATPHIVLGKIALQKKDYAKAETLLARGIQLDPASSDGLMELARCYAKTGRYELAVQSAVRARDLPGASPNIRLLLVDLYMQRDRRAEAIEELEAFAKLDPKSPAMPKVQQLLKELRAKK